jgi:anti-sigma factor RsiW
MADKHIHQRLSEYCRGEMTPEESRIVAEHLVACQKCRAAYDEIQVGVQLASAMQPLAAPEGLWERLESELSGVRSRGGHRGFAQSLFTQRRFQLGLAIAALMILTIGLAWYFSLSRSGVERSPEIARNETPTPTVEPPAVTPTAPPATTNPTPLGPRPARPVDPNRPSFEVVSLDGAPLVAAARVEGKGWLGVGEWLETDRSSRAQIRVADIGRVEVEPNSRISLLNSKATEHRLKLARGRIQAQVVAPPRIFVIETPSATAVDLGCEYVLEVDESGAGLLRVTSGYVLLEDRGHDAIVPAGAVCEMSKGGPGVPYFETASAKFRQALTEVSKGNSGAIDALLREAERRDTLTLWHLLHRVKREDRARVYDRMAALYGPPQGVTREGILKLNREMLEEYRKRLAWVW